MKQLYSTVTILSGILFFFSCTNSTKLAEGEMYPPVPDYAEITPYDDGSGLVKVTEYAADGAVLKQGDYLNNLREGVYTEFYNNGLLKLTCGYVGGLKQGQEIQYGDRGTIDQRSTYHHGQLHGPFVIYNRNRIKEKRNYEDGVLHGELLKFYNNGVMMESSNYVDGQLDGVAKWYDQQGNMTIEYRFKNGKRITDEE